MWFIGVDGKISLYLYPRLVSVLYIFLSLANIACCVEGA